MNNINKYDRIFTFGCSWTHYVWPTWADMIRYTDQAPTVFNWGRSGIGNVGIFYRMIECDLTNKFTENDLIIVQWSSWTREDRYINHWQSYGSIFNSPYYDEKFLKKYWHWNNDVIKNSSCILAANKMFNIGYQFNMLPSIYSEAYEFLSLNGDEEWHKIYHNALPKIESFPHVSGCFNGKMLFDTHPDIKDHLNFFNNNIKDRFGFTLEKNESEILKLYDSIATKIEPSIGLSPTSQIQTAVQNLIYKECKILDSDFPHKSQGLY
jgi:hypothetical protein